MRLYRNVALSRRALCARRLRSTLALLGLSVGIAAVIAVRALGEGAEREAVRKIESMGTNLLVVQAGRTRTIAGRARQESLATTLTLDDAAAIGDLGPLLAAWAPTVERALPIKYGEVMTRTTVLGTTPDYVRACNSQLREGRLFSGDELRSSSRVAVLGHQAARNLFPPPSSPIGETIRVGRIPFVVIGVLREKGVSQDGANEDDKIVIPITTAMRRLANTDHLKAVFVAVQRREDLPRAGREIAALLRDRHRLERMGKLDDFTIQSQATMLTAAREASRSFTTLGAWVGAVSLGVGAVGILSLMLLSVKERTPEIGLRMAVGSRPRDILVQFLCEALALGLAGGVTGTLVGIGAAAAIGALTRWETVVSVQPALAAITVSVAIGLLAGAYPARRAASLDPVVALASD